MKTSNVLLTALVLSAALALPGRAAADQGIAAGGAAGTYPPATTFAGVAISAIQSGFGADIDLGGTGRGQFCAILLGVSSLGLEQNVKIEGQVTGASQPAPNIAVLSGVASIDLGDGLPPAEGIPFTATLTANADGGGTIGLVTGLASLPDATIIAGSLAIR